jgi:hypothetical protein
MRTIKMRFKIGLDEIDRLKRETGLDISAAMRGGNAHHRIVLFLADGRVANYWPRTKKIEILENGY